jgi:4-amino-4-deoxy-L-arabinose transferase-like glycosyltransferase
MKPASPAVAASLRTGLTAAIAASPGTALAAIFAVHAAVWTVLPALLYLNLPLDLIEALMYGREWQLGYDKLPPLPWWMVEIAYRLVGRDFAYYLLAELAVLAAFVLVYATARPLVGGIGALVSVLVLDGLHYFNYTAVKFNHDVIQLPFWALAGYALHRGLRRRRLSDWILLGLALGLSLWAKYFVVVLAAPMIAFALVDRDARKALTTPGPYLAAAVALVVAAPHLVWLVQNDFLPLAYAEHRAVLPRGWYDHLWHPFVFAISQLFFLIPSLAIAAPMFWPHASKPALISAQAGIQDRNRRADADGPGSPLARGSVGYGADAFDRRIVGWLAFGPLATVLAMSAVSGRGTVAMWGYPLFLFLPAWLVLAARRAIDDARLARILAAWAVVFACLAAAFVLNYDVLPRFDHRYRAVFFPGEALADALSQRYRAATGQPIAYVIGTMWDGGNVAHYARSRPRVLVDGNPARAPWIDLADLRARGALVVWTNGDANVIPVPLRMIAADAQVQPPFALTDRRGEHTVQVGWAILHAQPSYAGAAHRRSP